MVYLFLADGFEEIEAITPLDVLRRAGKAVMSVGIGKKEIAGAHDIKVITDIEISQIKLGGNLEMIILPGGMPGTENLYASDKVKEAVRFCADSNIYIAAICAAPSIPGRMGLLSGRKATCFPGFEKYLKGATVSEDPVVRDDNIITSKAAGTSMQFALTLVEVLCGSDTCEKLTKAMQC